MSGTARSGQDPQREALEFWVYFVFWKQNCVFSSIWTFQADPSSGVIDFEIQKTIFPPARFRVIFKKQFLVDFRFLFFRIWVFPADPNSGGIDLEFHKTIFSAREV